MKASTTFRRTAITLDTVVDFLRDWFKSVLDDVTNLLFGMLIIVACTMAILLLVSNQEQIIYDLVSMALQADPALNVYQVMAIIGASLYIIISIGISILFSIVGFNSHRNDALDRIDELFAQIEESGLEEETARELIALLGEARSRGK